MPASKRGGQFVRQGPCILVSVGGVSQSPGKEPVLGLAHTLCECFWTFLTDPMVKVFLVYLHQRISLSRTVPGIAVPTCLQ